LSGGDGDFLARWSSRKLKARAEPDPEPAAPPAAVVPADAAPVGVEPDRPDEEILRELGLPDPDTLVKGDDFSAFLGARVPARLRTRALRRLWVSDPVLANLDGLNDYEEDFTDAATVVKDLKTAYRVGRGFLRDEDETAASASAGGDGEAAAAPEEVRDEPGAPADAEDAEVAQAESASASGAGEEVGDGSDGDTGVPDSAMEAEEAAPRPRRMRFRFSAG
jgi:hypothetical protein